MSNELTPSDDPELVAPVIECAFSAAEFCARLKTTMEVEPIYVGSIKEDQFLITLTENVERYYCVAIRGLIDHDNGNCCRIFLYKAIPPDIFNAFWLQLALLIGALIYISFPILYSSGELMGTVYLVLIGFVGLIGLQAIMYVQLTKQSNSVVRRQLIARIQQLAEGRSIQ